MRTTMYQIMAEMESENQSQNQIQNNDDDDGRQRQQQISPYTSPLPPPQVVLVAYDATRDHNEHELSLTINGVRMRGDILRGGDTLIVLGVLHTITNPMGYQTKACTDSFAGTNFRHVEEEVSRKADLYETRLRHSLEKCIEFQASTNINITAGTPTKMIVLQEVISTKAAWVILDRHFRRDFKFYERHIPCKIAIIQDSLSIAIVKPFHTNASSKAESPVKPVYSVKRAIRPGPRNSDGATNDDKSTVSPASFFPSLSSHDLSNLFGGSLLTSSLSSFVSHSQGFFPSDETESSASSVHGKYPKSEHKTLTSPHLLPKTHDSSENPVLCSVCGLRSILYIKESMRFQFSEIRAATSDFSDENLLGEGGFGFVYKGKLKDGQIIAAKLRKEESSQGYSEFFSEVHVLSFARHRNIVMLLGYCCKEKYNILVYEFICNKSLEWHLFSESAELLEWHKRYDIAIGIAKGLRFLHEECRAGPIIHRDLRPSNVLLTHDFVPMLGDFGLAKCKSSNDSFETRILGTSGYLAPEYAEYGLVSVRTDVYAFGILLFQLISGKKVLDETKEGQSQHILQWAEPLVESLALHELIDGRIGESYDTYELYHLAKAAFLCVRRNPELRPSMAEVVRLLEAENDRARDLAKQFVPHYTK